MKLFQLAFIIIGILTWQIIDAKSLALRDLNLYADGLNIEGGIIPRYALEENQIWANICFVLDRPLLNRLDLDEITKTNPYRLKEASLPNYNEPQAALVQALILEYYIENAHRICGIEEEDLAHIIVQVHRNSSGPPHLDLLENMIKGFLQQYKPTLISSRVYQLGNCILELRHGYASNDLKDYEGSDIIISISLVAGLHEEWNSGTALVPEKFIPFDLHSMVVVESAAFSANNHLLKILPDLITSQHPSDIEKINSIVKSPNIAKKHLKAEALSLEDFKKCRVLQVNGMFYPKQLYNRFEIY